MYLIVKLNGERVLKERRTTKHYWTQARNTASLDDLMGFSQTATKPPAAAAAAAG